MASRSGSRRATSAVRPGSNSCKAVTSTPPASKSDSESNELGNPEKSTLAPNHASVPAPVEPTLALKYSKADLIRILKIFSEAKSQKPKAEVPCKWPLKDKVPDVYCGKTHIDYYHFYQ